MNEVEIVKFDNMGRGIGYIQDKIIFVPKTVPGDIVKVKITLEKSNYLEGYLVNIIKPSKYRVEIPCPFFNKCGGCDLMNISISESLEYKLDKVNSMFKHNNIDYNVVDIIKSPKQYNYRNKITLKVVNKVIGYYENNSHDVVKIDSCLIANPTINSIIQDLYTLKIKNGEIIIRVNYKNELLLIINTEDEVGDISTIIDNYVIAGIIINDTPVFGDSFFIDSINNTLFKVSYNAFFQVNPYISSRLFSLVEEYTKGSKYLLDLYSGVGFLSMAASTNTLGTVGVEIVENATLDANFNKVLNSKENMQFICSDTASITDKISNKFDTVILDPPRNGVDERILNKIVSEGIKKIVYVSCNPITLVRDLNYLLDDYKIKEVKLLDMFPNTEHIECVSILVHK